MPVIKSRSVSLPTELKPVALQNVQNILTTLNDIFLNLKGNEMERSRRFYLSVESGFGGSVIQLEKNAELKKSYIIYIAEGLCMRNAITPKRLDLVKTTDISKMPYSDISALISLGFDGKKYNP